MIFPCYKCKYHKFIRTMNVTKDIDELFNEKEICIILQNELDSNFSYLNCPDYMVDDDW